MRGRRFARWNGKGWTIVVVQYREYTISTRWLNVHVRTVSEGRPAHKMLATICRHMKVRRLVVRLPTEQSTAAQRSAEQSKYLDNGYVTRQPVLEVRCKMLRSRVVVWLCGGW